jgi:hypothetical protein
MKLLKIEQLQETVEELALDLKALAEEHDLYCFNYSSDKEAIDWLHSMPIETLSDSINRDKQRARSKYSLSDIRHKRALRKLHEKKKDELETLQTQLSIAKIDVILGKIADIGKSETRSRT